MNISSNLMNRIWLFGKNKLPFLPSSKIYLIPFDVTLELKTIICFLYRKRLFSVTF